MISSIRCHIAGDSKWQHLAVYAAEVLFDGIGIGHEMVDNPEEAEVVYGNATLLNGIGPKVWIPAMEISDWNQKKPSIYWHELIPYFGPENSGESVFKGDMLYSVYAALTGCFETKEGKDDFGVPIVASGYIPIEVLETPIISLFCNLLREQIEQVLGSQLNVIPLWPNGEKFSIVMSHDVDAPSSVIGLQYRAKYARYLASKRQWVSAIKAVGKLAFKAISSLGFENNRYRKDPNLCFDKWVGLQHKLKTKSAFYIATTTSADEIGAPQDVTYNYRNPVFLEQVKKTASAGFEIGLHGSINAWRFESGIEDEKKALEKVLPGVEISGIRHHYWSLDNDYPERTLLMHQKSGFLYDSSLGLNDAPGFRRGMVWPYRPINPESGEVLSLIQVPPTLMDGGVFYHAVDNHEGATRIKEHIESVEKVNGCVVLNWHLEQMNPANLRQAGPVLSSVLMEYADREDIFWASPNEMAKWWKQRREQLDSAST